MARSICGQMETGVKNAATLLTMAKRKSTAVERQSYSIEAEWTEADLKVLAELRAAEELLPPDAPRALLSVRLSVLTEDTTSPVRQELDLRIKAREAGYRVVGVASDLNVSATKVPPWKRKELGDWLNNRVPEFDVILFWKLDRFIRRLSDLAVMIDWCQKYEKNLVSKNDAIDLTTVVGKIMVTLIGGIAEIEATNTSTRVTSLWDYTKTQSAWLVGKPAYGFMTAEDGNGRVKLVHDPDAVRALRWCQMRALRGASSQRMVKVLVRAGICGPGLTASTLLRRLRSPALLGYRTEVDNSARAGRSKMVLGQDGKPIRVAEPIFTQDEYDELQAALNGRGKNQPQRHAKGVSHFLGVLLCADCKSGVIRQRNTIDGRVYHYLRCQKCKSGGYGVPNPDEVYGQIVQDVLSVVGDWPVQVREYAQGAEARKEQKRLEESIAYYMKGLEPGGRYAMTRFTQEQAEKTLDQLIAELEAIDPTSTHDRWVNVHNGKTFREQWEAGGMEMMSADLLRVGIRCYMTRTKVKGVRVPAVHLKLMIPKDVRERLIVKADDFAPKF